MSEPDLCRICMAETSALGIAQGTFRARAYHFSRCLACDFISVTDPDTDYAQIYDEAYYQGRGADPLINYAADLSLGPRSAKYYEARGLETWVESSSATNGQRSNRNRRRWLDFGCGTGFLVEYLAPRWDAWGYETGAGANFAAARGIPLIQSADHLEQQNGSFDVVSCIEVLEHVTEPMQILRNIYTLLRPGGILVYTTGNSAPYLNNFLKWSYVRPEIHVSYFTDRTSRVALERTGFQPEQNFWGAGLVDIYRYKVLKNLKRHRRSAWQELVPWGAVAKLAQARYRLADHPMGRKPLHE